MSVNQSEIIKERSSVTDHYRTLVKSCPDDFREILYFPVETFGNIMWLPENF